MTFNCPQCANALTLRFKYSKLTRCSSCQSTIFLEDETVLSLGKINLLSDEPTLLSLDTPFTYGKSSFLPIGKIRYAHTIGFWEEWFVLDKEDKGVWISVDEGDMLIEEPLDLDDEVIENILQHKKLGDDVKINNKHYRITEKEKGLCQGFEGEIDRKVTIGESLEYMHLTALHHTEHITLEKEGRVYGAYIGKWIDIYELKGEDA